jgi:hypothetical protein
MSIESDTLARIDQGDKDHERDLAGLKSHWEREDAVTKENRDKTLAAFDQGAKDRAEARKRAKEALDPPVNARFTRAEIARLQALLEKEEKSKEPVATPLGQRETAARLQRERADAEDAERETPTPSQAPPQLPQRMSSLPAVSWTTPEEPPLYHRDTQTPKP